MESECERQYREMHELCSSVMAATFEGEEARLAQCMSHSRVGDLETWVEVLGSRPEACLLRTALLDYQQALLAVAQGLYVVGYFLLRSCLEQCLAAMYFSGHEYDLRLWLNGDKDLDWREVMSDANGALSEKFAEAFCPSLSLAERVSEVRGQAQQLYRECSEYIHGNHRKRESLPVGPEFNDKAYREWHQRAEVAWYVISFALCLRYLLHADSEGLCSLERTVIEQLGHIPGIRRFFEGAA